MTGILVLVLGALAGLSAAGGPPRPPAAGGGSAGAGGWKPGAGGVSSPPAGGGGPPRPPGDPAYPFPSRDLVESWAGDERGYAPEARHERLMSLARAGELDPIQWVRVPVRRGLEVAVGSDAVSYGGIRLCCSVYTAQQLGDVLGFMLPTAAIVRATHLAADLQIHASPEDPNRGGGIGPWLRHQDRIERAIAGRRYRLLSTRGKSYVLGQYVIDKPHNSPIYGWELPSAEASGPAGEVVHMIQSPRSGGGSVHGPPGDDGLRFFDYSHQVDAVHPIAWLDGREVELARVYRERPELVSHLGNRETIPARHPAVPRATGGAGS